VEVLKLAVAESAAQLQKSTAAQKEPVDIFERLQTANLVIHGMFNLLAFERRSLTNYSLWYFHLDANFQCRQGRVKTVRDE
jgi:hypothetical protein